MNFLSNHFAASSFENFTGFTPKFTDLSKILQNSVKLSNCRAILLPHSTASCLNVCTSYIFEKLATAKLRPCAPRYALVRPNAPRGKKNNEKA